MNSVMLRAQLPITQFGSVDLHMGAIAQHVAFKPDGLLSVWYRCSVDALKSDERVKWVFQVVPTGMAFDTKYPYLGTGVNSNGLVFHVFGGRKE